MNNEKQTEMLIQISQDVAEIKERLSTVYKTVMGNGKKGLLELTNEIEHRLLEVESRSRHHNDLWSKVATILSIIIALYVAFSK